MKKLDNRLFSAYIKMKVKRISVIIKKGVLYSSMDWLTAERPTGMILEFSVESNLKVVIDVRGYVFDVLLELVVIHAEIHDISRRLVKGIMSEVIAATGESFLENFRKV